MFLVGIICLVVTGLFWVLLGAIVGAVERRGLSTALLMILLASGMVVLCGCVTAVMPASPLSPRQYALASVSLFCAGFFDYMLFLTMGRAMRNGPNGVVWTVAQSGVIFPFLFGVVFYSVPVTMLRGLGMVAVLAALICNGLAKGEAECSGPAKSSFAGNWRFWMFLAFLSAGGNQVFSTWPSYYETLRTGFSAYSQLMSVYGAKADYLIINPNTVLREVMDNVDLSRRIVYILCAVILVMNLFVVSVIALLNMYDSRREIALMRLIGVSMKKINLLYLIQNALTGVAAMLLSLLAAHLCLLGIRRFVATMGIVLNWTRVYPLEWAILLAVFLLSVLPTVICTQRMAGRDGLER